MTGNDCAHGKNVSVFVSLFSSLSAEAQRKCLRFLVFVFVGREGTCFRLLFFLLSLSLSLSLSLPHGRVSGVIVFVYFFFVFVLTFNRWFLCLRVRIYADRQTQK